ncbi:DUF512 domain-containing protein [Natranaerobius trueperi]|uniref:Radical SAM protein n=1 Tax=Natranaerobius trueperi TaxID=759412 RepID=A0A226BXT7_9FIRM|nr:DUF512 domain-containing protein [Natranaerobius trueperi]OWZ82950.1 radical SAM protein [Natranaerobius trueperi]
MDTRNYEHIIKNVNQDSIAEEIGLKAGDKVLAINDTEINDILDYYFLISDDYIELLVRKPDGQEWIIEIEKDFDEKLGLEFENPTITPMKKCHNNCIFCFVNQLPSGMRSSLYVKDDDYRLSPFYGNYVTLTNLSDDEIDRLIRYRVSPMYISVHTTNSELRKSMLKNPKAGEINSLLERFYEAGINMHGQVVLCPGVNDGEELDRTIQDLINLYPEFNSLAVVPVGTTAHREGLTQLDDVSPEIASSVISQVERYQQKFLKKYGTRFVFLADEFYLCANKQFPSFESYENFSQIDNGVGLAKKFESEVKERIKNKGISSNISGTIITGQLGARVIKRIINEIKSKFNDLEIDLEIIPIVNKFFGPQVTVTGLITGSDIIEQLKGQNLKSPIFIPDVMLKDGNTAFLDDVTFKDLQEQLNVTAIKTPVNGKDFVDIIESKGVEGND